MSGDLDGARRLFEQALRIDPESRPPRRPAAPSPPWNASPGSPPAAPTPGPILSPAPLPRLFQDEAPPPPSMPEEWWTAPPSEGMGNTSRFFVRSPEPSAAGEPPP